MSRERKQWALEIILEENSFQSKLGQCLGAAELSTHTPWWISVHNAGENWHRTWVCIYDETLTWHGQPSSWTHLNAQPNNSIMGCTQTWMFTQKTKASIRGRQKGQSSVWQQLLPPAVVVKRFASTGYYLRLPSRAPFSYDGIHTSAKPASTIQLLHST